MAIGIPDPPAGAPTILGILLEPIRNGGIGRIRIGGLSPVRIEILDADHEFAEPIDGDPSKLQSAAQGPFRIVHKSGDSGVVWAIVQLSAPGGEAVWG